MFSRFIHGVAWINMLFCCIAQQHPIGYCIWTHHILFVRSWMSGHLGCFHVWAITNNAAMNTYVLVYMLWMFLGTYLGVELLAHMTILVFNVLRNHQTDFISTPPALHQVTYPPAGYEGSSFPISLLTLGIVVFLIIVILLGLKWYFSVVLICIFLMVNDVGHIVMCLLASCISPLEKSLFKSFAHLTGWLSFCCWLLRILYIFWIPVSYQTCDLWVIFSHPVSCLFTFLIYHLQHKKFKFWYSQMYFFFGSSRFLVS